MIRRDFLPNIMLNGYGYNIESKDIFGQPYPDFGINLRGLNFLDYRHQNYEAITHAIKSVFHSHFGIPECMVGVDIIEEPNYRIRILQISYNRGDSVFNADVNVSEIYNYNYSNLDILIGDAITNIIRQVLSTPVGGSLKEKINNMKFNLKDFKSWLEDEAEDEEFVNVFMEYFGEAIEDEKI